MVKHSKTAVKWEWWNDTTWVPYADCTTLENLFQDGEKRIKTDSQRFIDVDFSGLSAIKKQIHNDDKNLVGLQRRFDDESRRRAVRRIVPELFDSEIFYLTKTPYSDDALVDNIQLYGGLIVKKFSKKVSVIITDSSDFDAKTKKILESATASKKPILSVDFVDAMIQAEIDSTTHPNKSDFTIKLEDSLKRKGDDNSDEESVEQPKKKAKKALSSSGLNLQTMIKKGTVFKGSVDYNDGDKYPFQLEIEKIVQSGKANGLVTWSTLKDAQTVWDVEIDPNGDVVANEASAANVVAHEAVALGSVYKGKLSDKGDVLMGQLDESTPDGRALAPRWHMVAVKGLGKADSSMSVDDESSKQSKEKVVVVDKITSKDKVVKGKLLVQLPFEINVDKNEFCWLGKSIVDVDVDLKDDRLVVKSNKGSGKIDFPIQSIDFKYSLNQNCFEDGTIDDTHCSVKVEGKVEEK